MKKKLTKNLTKKQKEDLIYFLVGTVLALKMFAFMMKKRYNQTDAEF